MVKATAEVVLVAAAVVIATAEVVLVAAAVLMPTAAAAVTATNTVYYIVVVSAEVI